MSSWADLVFRSYCTNKLVMMQDASEDDAGDEALIETKPESTTQRKTRLEREAKLRKMMEDEEVEEDEDERTVVHGKARELFLTF